MLISRMALLLSLILAPPAFAQSSTNGYFMSQGRAQKFHFQEPATSAIDSKRRVIRFGRSTRDAWLTDEIVVGVETTQNASLIRKMPGFAGAAASWFSKRVILAKFSTANLALAAANQLALMKRSGIRYAHPNFLLPLSVRQMSADDAHPPQIEPLFNQQWFLQNTGQGGGTRGEDIQVVEAWQHTTGSPTSIIAAIDIGFEQNHPDLDAAWLVNTGEVPGNRRDDDQNGLVDDVKGWNFAINGNNLIYGPAPNHGTAVAGILGARANGRGVTGVCPRCMILPIVINGEVATAAAAFHYAKQRGASVISNSWGYDLDTPKTDVVVEAIDEVAIKGREGRGISIVFAMSNANVDDCRGPTPDISSLDSVIAVSSVDKNGEKVPASAHGACLDVVAPSGRDTSDKLRIVTTDRPGHKGYNTGASHDAGPDLDDLDYTNSFWGTSAATPQVAGVLGLLYSLDPQLQRLEAQDILFKTATQHRTKGDGKNRHNSQYGYGRIDANAAVVELLNRRGR